MLVESKLFYCVLSSRGECPDQNSVNLFVNLCHSLISKDPLSVIGVHCTHGYNRTGFLICAYLVEKLDWRYGSEHVLYINYFYMSHIKN